MSLHLLAVSGSLRVGSYNSALARAAAEGAPEGVTVEVTDLIRGLPFYDQDLEGDREPEPVRALRARFAAADGVLFTVPEYNNHLPGGLKNLIDWATRPYGKHCLVGKPVAVIGSSPSSGGARHAVEYLRTILPLLGCELVGEPLTIGKVNEQIDPATGAPNEALAAQVAGVVATLSSTARAMAELA